MTTETVLLTDFLTGPIPAAAFGPVLRRVSIEGEPEAVNAIVREWRREATVLFEGEYEAGDGKLGKDIIFSEGI